MKQKLREPKETKEELERKVDAKRKKKKDIGCGVKEKKVVGSSRRMMQTRRRKQGSSPTIDWG